jgi:hypothetical protein
MPARVAPQSQPKQHRTRQIAKSDKSTASPAAPKPSLKADDNNSKAQPSPATGSQVQTSETNCAISKRTMVLLLKQVHARLRYGLDTLLVGLMLLKRVDFYVGEAKATLLVAALLEIAAKVHEFRTPQFS